MEDKVYAVNITRFRDDYKSRGSSWSTNQPLKLFRSYEAAERYLAEVLLEEIRNRDLKEKLSDYYDDNGELLDNSVDAIFEMCDGLFVGEYVEKTFEYSIETCKVFQ